MRRVRWIGWVALIAIALGLFGCASGSSGPANSAGSTDPFDGSGGNTRDVMIVVDNRNTSDATLYVIWGAGNRVRLGRIGGLTEAEYTTRWHAPEVRMEARFLAGQTYVTNSLPVMPGEILELQLPGNLD